MIRRQLSEKLCRAATLRKRYGHAEGTDRSATFNVVEYAVQDMFKGKSILRRRRPRQRSSQVRELGLRPPGHDNRSEGA